MTPDSPEQRNLSGRSWSEFCDALRRAGETVLRRETPVTELDRAEGWRYLSRLTRIALESQLEFADADFPEFYPICHPTAKMGADNPDNAYRTACVRGDFDYVIRGTRGGAPYLSFGTKANRFGIDGSMLSTGELNATDLQLGEKGEFEVVVSARPQSQNWLAMTTDSNILVVRETFLDRKIEVPSTMKIERLNGPKTPQPLSAQRLDSALDAAGKFVRGTAAMFVDWTESFRAESNVLNDMNQETFQSAGGDPNIHYFHGYWALQDDEALVIQTEVPDCIAWNFQVDNYWMESLEYRYLPVNLNKASAIRSEDGSVTLVVAAQRPAPEIANWLATGGHAAGTMLLRWVMAKTHPRPRCEIRKLSELASGGVAR
jgi:hypothetical protein